MIRSHSLGIWVTVSFPSVLRMSDYILLLNGNSSSSHVFWLISASPWSILIKFWSNHIYIQSSTQWWKPHLSTHNTQGAEAWWRLSYQMVKKSKWKIDYDLQCVLESWQDGLSVRPSVQPSVWLTDSAVIYLTRCKPLISLVGRSVHPISRS